MGHEAQLVPPVPQGGTYTNSMAPTTAVLGPNCGMAGALPLLPGKLFSLGLLLLCVCKVGRGGLVLESTEDALNKFA